MQRTVVLGAGHWHLPLYRDAFAEHHQVVGVWDADAAAAKRAAADVSTTAHVARQHQRPGGPEVTAYEHPARDNRS